MSIQLEHGKYYRTRDGRKVGPLRAEPLDLSIRYPFDIDHILHSHGTDLDENLWTVDGKASDGPYMDLVSEWVGEPTVSRTDGSRADLAVAYPVDESRIGFTLTVAGKPQEFTMTRSAAASFIGRMAEVLAK